VIKQRSNSVQNNQPDLRVSVEEARRRASLDKISWDNMRLLLVLSECGSFRSAAVVAGISLNTIRGKIERLERQIGGPLIRRSVEGVALTQEGYEMVSIARQMRALGKSAERVQARTGPPRDPAVRMTITEGLGTFWLMPHLASFRRRNPGVHINVKCDMALPDVLFRDVDISVQLEKPTNPDLVVQKIGTLHLLPFASKTYVRRFGMPTSLDDAKDHKLVWQDADQVEIGLLPTFIDGALINNGLIAVTTSTSSAHYWAVSNGLGIGFLPSYVCAISQEPQPLDIGLQVRRPIFLVHHPDAARGPDVRVALDWIRGVFDKARYPWFADDFVHPDKFSKQFADVDIAAMFETVD
jgi:DNA-binding transcriptional LysR family regulator